MNKIFKNVLAILGGGFIGMVVNMGLIIAGSQLIPLADGVDPMNAKMWEIKYFFIPLSCTCNWDISRSICHC